MKKLSGIILELEQKGAIKDYYLHENYQTGQIELNIKFNNEYLKSGTEELNKILTENIREENISAFWE